MRAPSFARHRTARLPALALIAAACGTSPAPDLAADARFRPGQIAQAPDGMVVSASDRATGVGAAMLGAGGNAVDAAVAAAFVLSVVEPTMSGLGGRTQMVIRTADGAFVGLDGGTEIPARVPADLRADAEAGGYETVGIPGTVAALATAAARYGTKPLAELIGPAIALARDGFPLTRGEADRLAAVADRLGAFEGSRRHFLRADGSAFAPGDTLVQSSLAAVLRAVADGGPDAFYRGWIADSIAADMARHGGFVTRDDLAAYAVRPSLVVHGSYRGFDLAGTYLPASGATTIEALHVLEALDVEGGVGSPAWIGAVSRALLASFEDREADFGAPADHARRIVSPAHAAERAEAIRSLVGSPVAGADSGESPFTTHLSVIDGGGGAVALTQSVGPTMGSKVATPGLGFVYAATMGYLADNTPGARPFSSQSPLIVTRAGAPVMVLGASGARRIISALVAAISRMVDGGMTLADALASPRLHPAGAIVYVESHEAVSWPPDDLAGASAADLEIVPRPDAAYFAAVHGIAFDSVLGTFVGVSDPRRNGSASGPR